MNEINPIISVIYIKYKSQHLSFIYFLDSDNFNILISNNCNFNSDYIRDPRILALIYHCVLKTHWQASFIYISWIFS